MELCTASEKSEFKSIQGNARLPLYMLIYLDNARLGQNATIHDGDIRLTFSQYIL